MIGSYVTSVGWPERSGAAGIVDSHLELNLNTSSESKYFPFYFEWFSEVH